MSILNEEVIQSVIVSGVIVTTPSGVVEKGSKVESALKAIRDVCEKEEVIKRASKIAVVLIDEHENRIYTPNINYLASCLIYKNEIALMNWLLSNALSIVKPSINCPDILYSTSVHLLFLLEDFVNGHS